MLGHTYRYQIYNGTGVTVTVTLKDRRWKFDSSGARTDAAETTPINAASVSAGAYSNSSAIDNSSDKHLGAHLVVTAAPGASASGSVVVYLQHSTDGGTTWPDNGKGTLIDGIDFSASASAAVINMLVC